MELKWGLVKRMQNQKCKLVEENSEAFRGEKIRPVEVGGRQSAGVCPKPEGSREEVPPRAQMQEVKREQASSDYSSVAYGAVGGQVKEVMVEKIPVSRQEADEMGELKEESAITDRAKEIARQEVPVLMVAGEKCKEKHALCLGTVSDDVVTLVGRQVPTGDESGHGVIGENVAKDESLVGITGARRSRNGPGGLQVVVMRRRPGGQGKQRSSSVLPGKGEGEVKLQRKAGDRKKGEKGIVDRKGSRVRIGNRVRVVAERQWRNATPVSPERGKARGPRRRHLRKRVARPSGGARESVMGKKIRMRPRKGHMGIMKRLRRRRTRVWMGTVTQGLKDAEIFWRGNAREFGKLGFRDKPI